MGTSTRSQVYPYQYKINSVTNVILCGAYNSKYSVSQLGLSVPDSIIQMTSLWMHINISFNASEPTANQTIQKVSVGNVTTGNVGSLFTYNFPTVGSANVTPTATGGILDFKVNLQSLLGGIYYFPSSANWSSYFELSIALPPLQYTATINIWKVDMIYTTLGIR